MKKICERCKGKGEYLEEGDLHRSAGWVPCYNCKNGYVEDKKDLVITKSMVESVLSESSNNRRIAPKLNSEYLAEKEDKVIHFKNDEELSQFVLSNQYSNDFTYWKVEKIFPKKTVIIESEKKTRGN